MDLIYSLVNAGADAVNDMVRDVSAVKDRIVDAVVREGVNAGQDAADAVKQAADYVAAQARTPLQKAMQDPDTAAAVLTINAFNDAGVISAYINNAGYVQQGRATDYLGNALAGLEAGMRRYIDGGLNAVNQVITGLENNTAAFINEARKLLAFVNSFSGEMLQDAFQVFVTMFWNGLAEAL
jgi:hypothetical protein